ncbi:hypothetical protein [Streptomyces sp. R44]|uniref:Uncharacterized protein n=1 Tax=Streptomyces sp. R44 TaxID=3238633 RepID=A0AB39SSM1_9ACTN
MTYHPKHIRSLPPLTLRGRQMKLYHVTNEPGTELPAEITDAAHAAAAEMVVAPDDGTPPVGWLVLHQGRDAMYLCVYSWVWDNVVLTRTASAGEPHLGGTAGDLSRYVVNTEPYTGCVWELPVLGHERTSFVRHILQPPAPDIAAYLADALADGPTDQPLADTVR